MATLDGVNRFALVSGAHSAEKNLLVRVWRAQRSNFVGNTKLGQPFFSGISRAQRRDNFAFATLSGAVRRQVFATANQR